MAQAAGQQLKPKGRVMKKLRLAIFTLCLGWSRLPCAQNGGRMTLIRRAPD